MNLAVDIGNTQTVLGIFKDGLLDKTWRIATSLLDTSDDVRNKVQSLLYFSEINLLSLKSITVSSVVPRVNSIYQIALQDLGIQFIDHQAFYSFQILASPAESVGIDRLVNAEAAVREYPFPSIILDSGTATTLCAIDQNSSGKPVYLGGAIIPGMEMALEALLKNTALLHRVDLTPPEHVIGGNTEQALKSGIVLGYASMLDGMIDRFKDSMGLKQVTIIATGGVSQRLKGLLKQVHYFDPNLTLKGIYSLYVEALHQR